MWLGLGILYVVCLVCCLIGFYKFVYFLSVGYGFSVTGCGIAIMIMDKFSHLEVILIGLVLVAYGIRLGGFLLWREIKSAAYKKTLKEASGEKPMPVFVKATIWLCVGLMYVAQVSPVYFRVYNGEGLGVTGYIGAVIMLIALIIESIADKQKSAAKAVNPNRFCDTGLYKIVRCPNYLGEMLFWTGVIISGIGAVSGWLQWVIAIVGYILIIYVMLSGAKRLEIRQNKNYGADPEYQAYVKKTPIVIPLIPLYHLENVKGIVV